MPTTRPFTTAPLLLALIVAASGCDGALGPASEVGLVPESELTFVRVAADAPPLDNLQVSFWATPGEMREAEIRYVYRDAAGTITSTKCLLFRVPAGSLRADPTGRPIAAGDSVRITVRLVDKSQFRFEFQPAGLQFQPGNPARLEVRYRYLSDDLNGDGVVDVRDATVRDRFGWWRSEGAGRWEPLRTLRYGDVMEAHASVTGFSQFALASN